MQILNRRKLLLGAICVVAALVSSTAQGQGRGGPAPVAVSTIRETGELANERFVGTSQPIRHSVIGSAVDGRVQELFVGDGEFVSSEPTSDMNELVQDSDNTSTSGEFSGQALLQLRTQTLEIEIRSAEATLSVSEHNLAILKASLSDEMENALAMLESAQATFDFAETDHDRMTRLQQTTGAVSEGDVELALSNMRTASAELRSAQSTVDLLTATQETKIAQATAQLEVEREAVNLLRDQFEKYTIRAPFSGYVTVRHVEVGDWVSRGDPVIEVVQLDPIEVRMNVPEDNIGDLRALLQSHHERGETMKIDVRFPALRGQHFPGEIIRIVPQSDLRSRSYPVIIHVDNPQSAEGAVIQAGMIGQAELPVGQDDLKLMVPKDAVVLNGATRHVVVAKTGDDGTLTAQIVPVSIGISIDDRVEIRGDVEAGQQVVVEGNERLRVGQALRIVSER